MASVRALALFLLFMLQVTTAAVSGIEEIDPLIRESFQLSLQSKAAEALPLAERAVELSVVHYGQNTKEHARALNNLAGIYRALARWDDAVVAYKRAIELRESYDRINLPTSLANLGLLYRELTRYGEAETAMLRAIELYRRTRQLDRMTAPQTNLGLLYAYLGRYEEAEKVVLAAYSQRLRDHGAKSLDVANSLLNLAAVYKDWGRISAAEAKAKEALAIREALRGRDHLDVANALNVLAEIARTQRRLDEALSLLRRTNDIRRARLSEKHPDLAFGLHSQAGIYEMLGRLDEAEAVYLEALSIREAALGPGDLNLAATRAGLGAIYKSRGKLAEAERLLLVALAAQQAALGDIHASVVETMSLLGELYRELGDQEKSKRYFDHVDKTRKDAIWNIPIFFGTNRIKVEPRTAGGQITYGSSPSDELTLGKANVWVQHEKIVAQASRRASGPAPDGTPEMATEVSRLVIQNVDALGELQFTEDARFQNRRAHLFSKQALVFVHGYNVSFENAVRRAAQLSYDLKFDGNVFLFTWPSRGGNGILSLPRGIANYPYDRESAGSSIVHLQAFLQLISEIAPVRLHLIAHSMGNLVLLEAIDSISSKRMSMPHLRVGEVISAAPDVGVGRFKQIAPNIARLGAKLTLYASASDWALTISKAVWGGTPRAGLVASKEGPLVVSGVDSIDVTAAGDNPLNLNHDVYAANGAITGDIHAILSTSLRPPSRRPGPFQSRQGTQGAFWEFSFGK